jgi:hypothetical protein
VWHTHTQKEFWTTFQYHLERAEGSAGVRAADHTRESTGTSDSGAGGSGNAESESAESGSAESVTDARDGVVLLAAEGWKLSVATANELVAVRELKPPAADEPAKAGDGVLPVREDGVFLARANSTGEGLYIGVHL